LFLELLQTNQTDQISSSSEVEVVGGKVDFVTVATFVAGSTGDSKQ
jgi:hypothetical protein